MNLPLIGITTSLKGIHPLPDENYQPYFDAVEGAGGEPWIIGKDQPLNEMDELLARLGGLLFSGGGDVQTHLYHGDESIPLESVSRKRDALELALIPKALALDLPLLGICRGLQVLNVACGGTLITDIGDSPSSSVHHNYPSKKYPRDMIAHKVTFVSGSRLAEIYQSEQVSVNSRHHQAVNEVAPGWQVAAQAPEGLIEALELPSARFALGVQWHPENLQAMPGHKALLHSFIAAAGV
jgi:putative glutamine amidotransferase